MKSLRSLLGISSLFFFALALNLLVWRQDLFTVMVAAPLGLAVICGLLWLILLFASTAGRNVLEGRAVGGVYAVLSSLLFLGICMVLYAFSGAWDVSWDLTQEGRRDLAKQTVQVLQSMSEEVQVTCFFLDVDDELVLIARDKTLRFIEQCQRYTDLLKLEVLDPQVDRTRLEAMNITHASTQGTIVLRSGSRQRVITLSGGSPRLEERDFTNSLINVLRNTQPKVCFLTGHHERDIIDEDESTGASMLGNLLVGEAYAVDRIAIKISAPEIASDCDILVINNPQSDLHPAELQAIEAFLDRGGRLFLLIDPWRQITQGAGGKEELRPWLRERYGIDVGFNIVITDQQENIWESELSLDGAPFDAVEEGFMEYRGSFYADHAITRGFDQVMLLQANRSVSRAEEVPEGVIVTELLRTTPDFWAESDVVKLAETGQAQKTAEEESGPLSLAVAAVAPVQDQGVSSNRPRDTRVVVVGDSDFASNGRLGIAGHLNFMLNTFAWLSENEDLIAIRPTGKDDPALVLSQPQQRAIAWISTLFTVQVVALAGLATFFDAKEEPMKLKSTVFLAGLLVLLCVAYWAMQERESSVQREKIEAKRLFEFSGQEVQSLSILRLNEAASRAERGEEGLWKITDPNPTIVAFQYLWDRSAEHLALLPNERSLVQWSGNLEEYGLEPPALTVAARTASGRDITLVFGAMEPTGNFRYARLDNEALFLVKEDEFYELNRPLSELRNRFLVDDREANILRFEFARIWTGEEETALKNPPAVGEESVRVAVARTDAGSPWRLVEPMDVAANQEEVEALVKEVQFAVGRNHVDAPEALADYGLDPARVRISVVDDNQGRKQTLFLGMLDESEEGGAIFGKRADRDAVFEMDAHLLSLLPRSPLALREKRLLSKRASEIESLLYEGDAGRFLLRQEGEGGWKVVEPALDDSDQARISTYLSYLKEVRGQRFLKGSLEDFGLDAPEATLTFSFQDGSAPAVIRLAPYAKDPEYFCATQDTGAITLVPTQFAQALLATPDSFVSLGLIRLERTTIKRLDFVLDGVAYDLRREHGLWSVLKPEGQVLSSQDDVKILLDAITPLRAASKAASDVSDASGYGLDSPVLRLSIYAGEEALEEHGPLLVGAVTPEDSQLRYARIAQRSGLYSLSQEVLSAFREALRGLVAAGESSSG